MSRARGGVLYLTPGCFDKGGISRYNRYQVRALRELLGSDAVSVLSVLGPGDDSFEDAIQVDFAAGGVQLRQKAMFSARALDVAMRARPRLVLAAHVNLGGLAVVLARATGAVSVLNVYGAEVWSGFRMDSAWGLRNVDYVVSDCHFTAQYLQAESLRSAASMDVVWDCVDLQQFSPGVPSAAVMDRYGIPAMEDGINLLTFGRMSPDAAHKGYDRLLDVFVRVARRRPDVRLIYGGRGGLVDALRARAAARGVSERVFFTGMVREEDLADVYRSAHIFSLVSDRGPGRGEGIPLTPLEAGACGVPIVVGNHDGSQEAIVRGQNGFVVSPYDLDGHAEVIERLASDRTKREEMGRAAAACARVEFSFETFRHKHEKLVSRWLPGGLS